MKKQEALKYLQNLPEDTDVEITAISDPFVSSGVVERMGISRQLLRYYVKQGYVRTTPSFSQKHYSLNDLLKVRK